MQELSSIDRMYYHLPQGVLITAVDPESSAHAKGILPGDLLLSIGNMRITEADSVTEALYAYEAGDTMQLGIYRNGSQYLVEITVGQAK